MRIEESFDERHDDLLRLAVYSVMTKIHVL